MAVISYHAAQMLVAAAVAGPLRRACKSHDMEALALPTSEREVEIIENQEMNQSWRTPVHA